MDARRSDVVMSAAFAAAIRSLLPTVSCWTTIWIAAAFEAVSGLSGVGGITNEIKVTTAGGH